MQAQRQETAAVAAAPSSGRPTTAEVKPRVKSGRTGLSFSESHRLKALPDEIARLEAEIDKLSDLLSDPELFSREPVKFRKASEAMAERQAKLIAAEEEWLMLEEKAEAAG
jgi:ATP-binding cassette subfamily F protein uup